MNISKNAESCCFYFLSSFAVRIRTGNSCENLLMCHCLSCLSCLAAFDCATPLRKTYQVAATFWRILKSTAFQNYPQVRGNFSIFFSRAHFTSCYMIGVVRVPTSVPLCIQTMYTPLPPLASHFPFECPKQAAKFHTSSNSPSVKLSARVACNVMPAIWRANSPFPASLLLCYLLPYPFCNPAVCKFYY